MIVTLAPEAIEGYLRLQRNGEEVEGVDECLELLDRILPRQFNESAPDKFRLGKFDIHRLRGVLAGWWSADTGLLQSGRKIITVFYAEGHKATIVAVAEHDQAYLDAIFKRAELAPTRSRRREILRRIR